MREKYDQKVKEDLQAVASVLHCVHTYFYLLTANYKSVLHYENIAKGKLKYLLDISLNGVINDSDKYYKVFKV